MAFAAITAVCWFVSKRDERHDTTQTAQHIVENFICDENNKSSNNMQPEAVVADVKEDQNGMDYADKLVERVLDDSVDFNWNDLPGDIRNTWNRLKASFGKGKISKSVFKHVKRKFVVKTTTKLIETADAVENSTLATTNTEAVNVERDVNVSTMTLDNAKSRETWRNIARNLKKCAWNELVKNSGKLVGPIEATFITGSILMNGWMRSRKANRIQLMASCREDEESNYTGHITGGISPFVQYVIMAISDNEYANAEKLDIKTLYESVAFDASNKVIGGGFTLHDIDQHPVSHFIPN
eukprot:UN00524